MNEKIVSARGECHLVLDAGLIESALTRPLNLFLYEGVTDIFMLGVRLMEAIGKNHCFEQGNKRTAHMAALSFMRINGSPYQHADTSENAKVIRRVITGLVSFNDVITWCRPLPLAA
ncbi:type II toxin-antitoxin system death-on-curing family toxin [Methylobacterium sp. J-068]|nr:type II toxin-antitoxin system death-on-curing family toxin [Methylobacterium sp. J-068]